MHKEKRGKGEKGREKLYVTFFFSEHIDIKFVWHIHTGNPAMLKIEEGDVDISLKAPTNFFPFTIFSVSEKA